MILIGLCGKKRHGKDTMADYLVNKYGFIKLVLAEPIKNICKELFGFTDEQLYGNKKEDIDEFWKISPRTIMQYFGTEIMRNKFTEIMPHIGDNIFIEILKKKIYNLQRLNNDVKIVVSDIRYLNEVEMIHSLNGFMFKIIRNIVNNPDDHSSETTIDQINCCIIDNNNSIENFYLNIDKIASKFKN